jgi:DNA replication protein DnaC
MTDQDTTQTSAMALASALGDLEKAIQFIPPEIRESRRKEAAAYAQRQLENGVKALLDESRAPQRQLNNINIQRDGEWGAAEKKILSKIGSGFFISLIGNRGCGKTQLAVEAIRLSADKGRRARYCTATEFFMEIKATYGTVARSEKDVLNDFTKPSLLVIDEIGQRSESEWENRLLFELLNRRYNALKDTLLISNQSAEEFTKSMGPSLISRMIETGGLMECKWHSYRK